MSLGGREAETVFNIVTLLQGKAWDLVEDFTMEQLAATNAFEAIFARLDSGFRYDPLTELPEDFETYFVKLMRKPGQTLQDYVMDFTKAERRLKITHEVDLPEKVKAWWFLRRSGITKEQRQLILTNVGTQGLSMDEVTKAMSFILGQDSKTDGNSSRWSRQAKADIYYYNSDDLDQDWGHEIGYNQLPVFYEAEEDPDEEESWFDEGQDYYEDINEPVFDVDEYDEVYTTYQDAKARLNSLRTARGFYPVVVSLDTQAAKGSTVKPKGASSGGKKGKSKSKSKSAPKGKGPNPKARASSAMGKTLCLRCGQPGHWAKNCPQSSDKKRRLEEPSPSDINMVLDETYRLDEDEDLDMDSDDKAVQDGGAASVLGSRKAIRRYLRFLLEKGFNLHAIELYDCKKTFTYGNSQRETTNRCLLLPTFFGNRRVDVLTYIINGEAPMLFGRPLLEELGLTMDYKNKQMRWEDGEWEAVEIGTRGEHLLRLGKYIDENVNSEPAKVLLPLDFDDHVMGKVDICELLEDDVEIHAVTTGLQCEEPVPAEAQSGAPTRPAKGGTEEEEHWGETKRLHGHRLRKMMMQAENEVRKHDKVLMMSQHLRKESPLKRVVWEVFVGEGRTSKFLEGYPNVTIEVFSYETGWDFALASARKEFLRRLRQERPDEILLAPPCRLWSPLQELNIAKDEHYKERLIRDRRENHDTLLMMCSTAYLEQQRGGRHATLEHPWGARSWNTKAMRQIELNSYDCYVDQCMYDLILPSDDGELHHARKPTCFRTTKEELAVGLMKECDGTHAHLPIEGTYGGKKRSQMAEDYPPSLAENLAFLLQLDNGSYDTTVDHIYHEDDDEEDEPERQGETDDLVAKNRKLQAEVGSQVMQYVKRLHKNLGHPSPKVLTQMLLEIQATEDVLKAAKEYECVHCHERRGPAGVPPAAGLTARSFGERLLADTAWIDTDEGRVPVITMMDQATRYVALRMLKSEKSKDLVKSIVRGWVKHFGTPRYLRLDEAKGFAAQYLRDWCSEHNIVLEIAPAECHNWLGSVERKHQVVRRTLELYMAEKGTRDKKTLEEATHYCPGQINNLSFTRGYTPAQWVLGRSPEDTMSLTARFFSPGVDIENEPMDYNDIQGRRLAAQLAFLRADSDARLRRAMNQNYQQLKTRVVVGQRCWYWRVQGSGILQKNKWRGPARCVAEECSDDGKPVVLWLCHGTSLLRCAPHQVRPCVEELGEEMPIDAKAALDDLKSLRARSTTQFKDVSELRSQDAILEDLIDDDELYQPSLVPSDQEREDVEMPGTAEDARAFEYQRARDGVPERDGGQLLPGPTAAEETISLGEPDEEADVLRKRESAEEVTSPTKKAKTSASATVVPEAGDGELFIEDAFIAEIHDKSLPKSWRLIDGEFELDEIYLAQLRNTEANEKHMTVEERERMVQAKVTELQNFFNNQVWEFTELGKVNPSRVVHARWVLTWKKPDDGSLQRKAKARLVLKGFQDPDIMHMDKAAPTAGKTAKMLLLSLVPNMDWAVMCGDVRAAFLSGANFDREIIVKLPKDCGPLLGCLGETHMKMNKSAYGLCDAPLLWWQEADRRLRRLKLKRHKLDKCCYMLYSSEGWLLCVLILHVDDVLLGIDKKTTEGQQFLKDLRASFDFGKWQELSPEQPIVYCGGHITMDKKGNVSLGFEEYLKKVMPVTIARGRNPDDHLLPGEVSKMRGLIGALQWPAGQGCPQLSASVSLVAGDVTKGTIKSLQELNKTLRFAKQTSDVRLNMTQVIDGIDDLCFVCFSDAAYGARSDGSSQGGYIIVMASKQILEGKACGYNIVGWRSFKLSRVCRSSLSAEGQGCSTALDELMMLKTMCSLMFFPDQDPRDAGTAASFGSSAIVIDAKGLYDALQKDCIGSGSDKRAAIDILCIKEELSRLQCQLRWVSSERMLADGLTKQHARQNFVDMLRGEVLQLVQDESFTAAKKKDRAERARSMASTFGNNRIAEKIGMVVLADAVRCTEGSDATPSEETDWGYMILVVTVLVFMTELFMWTYRAAGVVHYFMNKFKVKGWCCLRRKTVSTGVQARPDRDITLLEVMQVRVDQLEAENDQLRTMLQDHERDRVQQARNNVSLRSLRAASSNSSVVLHEMPVYYTANGSCWHCFSDCHSLRHSSVLAKERPCLACRDRLHREMR